MGVFHGFLQWLMASLGAGVALGLLLLAQGCSHQPVAAPAKRCHRYPARDEKGYFNGQYVETCEDDGH